MQNFKLYSLILLLSITQGCATSNLKRNPNISLPLQIMEAADRSEGIKDIDRVEFDKLMAKNRSLDYFYLAESGAYAVDLMRPVSGISKSTSISMGLLQFLMSNGVKVGENTQLLVWMPKTMATDKRAAQVLMGRKLEDAAISTLPEGYSSKPFEWVDKAVLGALSEQRVIKVNGPLCPEWSCVIKGSIPTESHLTWRGKMKEVDIPEYVSGGPGKGYGYSGLQGVELVKITKEYDETGSRGAHWHRMDTEYLKNFDHRRWYVRISEKLPAWAYYVHMPNQRTPENTVFSIPVMLNQGKPLMFVKPDK